MFWWRGLRVAPGCLTIESEELATQAILPPTIAIHPSEGPRAPECLSIHYMLYLREGHLWRWSSMDQSGSGSPTGIAVRPVLQVISDDGGRGRGESSR
jgi:hypothetical protein